MGFAALGQCWPSVGEAAAAVCGSYPVAGSASVTSCSGVAAGVLTLVHETSAGSSTFDVQPFFPVCDVMEWAGAPLWVSPVDASLMGAAVAGVLLSGFAWRAIRAALSDRDLG